MEALQLGLDRGDDMRVAMSRGQHGDTASEVDETLARDIPNLGILSARGEHLRLNPDAARTSCLSSLFKDEVWIQRLKHGGFSGLSG
ncbi:hypothetical protein D9M68_974430 [compost metagenome]